jgi:hypothetical protein
MSNGTLANYVSSDHYSPDNDCNRLVSNSRVLDRLVSAIWMSEPCAAVRDLLWPCLPSLSKGGSRRYSRGESVGYAVATNDY